MQDLTCWAAPLKISSLLFQKPSAFGSPRRASITLQGLFKLAGKVLPFSYGRLCDIYEKIQPRTKQILLGLSIQIS